MAILAGCLVITADATSIDPATWPELVERSDLTGIIECTVAGGIVAKYRVVEAWKGEIPDGEIALLEPPDFWGPVFPTALVGQRFLVTARKARGPSSEHPGAFLTLGGVVPLWWRSLPFDYEVPLFQGKTYVYPDNTHKILFGSEIAPPFEFRERVQAFVAMGDEERHIRILKARMRKYLGLEPRSSKDATIHVREVYEELSGARSVKGIVQGALTIGHVEPEEAVLVHALGQAVFGYAHPEVLTALKRLEGNPSPFAENDVKHWLRSVHYTLDPPKHSTSRPDSPLPSFEGGREAARQALSGGLHKDRNAYKFWQAFEYLSLTAPQLVTDWLSTWENPQEGPTMLKAGYELGSAFGYLCKTDRDKHLKKLLRARDPYVQVSAAVYLAFENEAEGLEALEKFTQLPGDPGAWAALTLARRGQKEAVSRLLEVFDGDVDSWSLAVLLRTQTAILLSNSAAASGVPMPMPPARSYLPADAVDYADYYLSWWREHEPKVHLYDPWFPALAEQKID